VFRFLWLQPGNFHTILPEVRQKIVNGFTTEARDLFDREFAFFDNVTSISGVLFPLPKEERRAGIRRYLYISSFLSLIFA
jgi:phosphatidylinositol 4-kinase A